MAATTKRRTAIFMALGIALLTILIGFLGELMPEAFSAKLTDFVTENLGLSYTMFWSILVIVVVGLTLFLIWRGPAKETVSKKTTPDGRMINQRGKKSVYIEKNKGDINIK